MTILYTDISKIKQPQNTLGGISSVLPVREQQRISRLRFRKDQLLSAAGLFMVSQIKGPLNDLKRDSNNRPYIEGQHPDFNISHSGNLAVTLFYESGRCGIDVEEIKEVEISDFKRVMTEEEWENTHTMDQFYNLWTQKEAVLKALGSGFTIEPNEVVLGTKHTAKLRGETWFTRPVIIDKSYCCHIATDIKDLRVKEIKEFKI